ncbi:MAG: glycosyltransferase family 2 protein [Deltaproteobacteria bacterium]|nr:glycosyltransferase family 2 protein [Deltaproteobacteria bacterium]
MKVDVSIIIPAHNEEGSIHKVISGLESALKMSHEIIVVNDHSMDTTKEIVTNLKNKYKNLILIDNDGENGFANTLKKGLYAAAGEYAVPVMADACDDAPTINVMYSKAHEGFDIVCGSRYMKMGKSAGAPVIKSFLSYLASLILYFLLRIPTHDITNAFKMYHCKILKAIDIESKGFEISIEIPIKAYIKGFTLTEVPTIWYGRTTGKSNFKIFKMAPRYLKWCLWGVTRRYFV